MTAERGHPPSRPPAGPPPAHGGPRLVPAEAPGESGRRGGGPRAPADAPGAPGRGGGSRRPHPASTRAIGPPLSAAIEPVPSRGPRRLAKPKPVRVKADMSGRPQLIGKREVDAVRESWLVEDRWWTDEPLRRRYWEVVTGDGRDLVVFRDLVEGRWYAQR
jgi:hypothetical protein